MKKVTGQRIALISFFALASFLRFYNLGGLPAGFFCDEASIGFNAYSILTKGADEFGIPYPIFFKAFGEYKGPIQIYSTLPFIFLFGLSEYSVRLVSAVFGSLSIFAIYLLAKELFKKFSTGHLIALFAALFLAISPWHIHLSRVSFELMPFVLFTTLGLYLFLRFQSSPRLFPFSILVFTLALYSYSPARIFIPIFTPALAIYNFKYFLKHKLIILFGFFLLAILLIPILRFMLSSGGWARWQGVNIFSHPPNNTTILNHVLNNYLSHFSLDFLFLKGDVGMPGQNITRHSVRRIGELYLFQLPLIFIGLFYLLKKKSWQALYILLSWLLLYPSGSALTLDQSAQATRSVIGVVPFQIISAVGLIYFINFFRTYILKIGVVILCLAIVVLSFQVYLEEYFHQYPLYSSGFWGWQYGPREIMKYFLANKNDYDDLFMSGEFNESQIFFKFYDPQITCQNKCKIGDLWRTPKIYNSSRRQLFSLSPDYLKNSEFNDKFNLKKTIYYPNGSPAFLIGEVARKTL